MPDHVMHKENMNTVKITFFMIVTDRDILIADYAVRSYAGIRGLPFKLLVYSNWVSSALKEKFFTQWRRFPFVEIVDDPAHADDRKPTDRTLEGPYEMGSTIWDRELRKIDTPYHATVDADFEILDQRFIHAMLRRLDKEPNLVAMATDYSATLPEVHDSYSNEVICFNERWHTWFCIYKKAACACTVSHAYHEEVGEGSVRRNVWDDAGYYQKNLKDMGFELAELDRSYQPCFIHYGAFSKFRSIDESNIALYRRLRIIAKKGIVGRYDILSRASASILIRLLFPRIEAEGGSYWPGWAQGEESPEETVTDTPSEAAR